MIVCKFGGSSVASSSQIIKVKKILDDNPNRRIIVVSAPGKRDKDDEKITDLLYECNALVRRGESCKSMFKRIADRYLQIAYELGLDQKPIELVLDDIRYRIDAGSGKDYTASRGEYLSAFIISQYLKWEFVDAEDSIIIKQDGTVNPVTYDRLKMIFEDRRKRYVIPGFYGSGEDHMIKTFTRGGSDITGSVVARAVGADLYENWTDVSGMFSADPRIIPSAKVIDTLSYKEVRELSEFGATVFHEEAIAPIQSAEIPVNIRNTNRPEDSGTMIVPSSEEKKLAGLAATGGLSRLSLRRLMLFKGQGTRHALLTMLHIFGVRPVYSLYGVDSVSWFFDSKSASASVLESMCQRLKSEYFLDEAYVESGYAILGLVGSNIDESDAYLTAASALRKNGIDIRFINYGASDVSVTYGIKESDKEKAVKVVYDALFK